MGGFDFNKYWEERRKIVNRGLDKFLPADSPGPRILTEAMRYTLFAGGKRLRPLLAIIGYELSGGTDLENELLPIACGIEMIHTFSLIHDDLPAMDNDDFRRGKPTNHKVFGEAIAILAGDALFGHAFYVMVRSTAQPSKVIDTIREITDAIGLDGMLGGQVADVTGEKQPPSKELVQYIHSRKTGKFIRASLKAGGIIAGADETTLTVFHEVGEKIGLTFQIVDDILDEIGEKDKLGKSVGKDRESGKQTYVRVFGLDEAKARARELAESAIEQINSYFGEEKGLPLTSLTKFIIERNF